MIYGKLYLAYMQDFYGKESLLTSNNLYLLFPLWKKKIHINYILQKEMSCSKTTQHKLSLIYLKTWYWTKTM